MKKGAIKIPSEQGATLDAMARLRELRSTHALLGTCLATPTGWPAVTAVTIVLSATAAVSSSRQPRLRKGKPALS